MFFKSQAAGKPKEKDLVVCLSEKTKPVFEKELSTIPSYPPDIQRRLDAYKKAHLINQAKTLVFNYRCNEIEKLGFQKVNLLDLAKKFGAIEWWRSRQTHQYEWFYDHTDGATVSRYEPRPYRPILFHDNHSGDKCLVGCLDYLKNPMPYGIVLKMQELKKANLFNAFNVLAPMECWRETPRAIDPILLGVVHELTSDDPQEQYFFIAEWE